MNTLAEIVLHFVEFLEITEEPDLNLDVAVKQQECIWAALSEATPEERAALAKAASDELARLLADPDEHGYTPRKAVSARHRELLEAIVGGGY